MGRPFGCACGRRDWCEVHGGVVRARPRGVRAWLWRRLVRTVMYYAWWNARGWSNK